VSASAAELVERLFEAFNGRSEEELIRLCDERIEFAAVGPEMTGRAAPYRGHEGLREYLADVERLYEELVFTAWEMKARGDSVVVSGRVYARSRASGIRDLPAAWKWDLRDGRFVTGQVSLEADETLGAPRVPAADP
jgi:ketosteroid isomerase-like protein